MTTTRSVFFALVLASGACAKATTDQVTGAGGTPQGSTSNTAAGAGGSPGGGSTGTGSPGSASGASGAATGNASGMSASAASASAGSGSGSTGGSLGAASTTGGTGSNNLLCAPCTSNAQCAFGTCIDDPSGVGHYCAPLCNTNNDCPQGAICYGLSDQLMGCYPLSETCVSFGNGAASDGSTGGGVGGAGGNLAGSTGTVGTLGGTIGGTGATGACDCASLGCAAVGEVCDPSSCSCVTGPPRDAGGCGLRTCASVGANCGPLGDGCDGVLQCGACTSPNICGGAGASVCGLNGGTGGNGGGCTNLCLQQVSCPNGGATTITGTVYAPTNKANGFGNPDPLPNALVYVPNSAVQPFAPGVACEVCGEAASGDPLVTTTSAADGTFTLSNVPVGGNIPLVIQLGRWRRQITIPSVPSCKNTALTADQTRMPRNHTEGDIPLMAMVTGKADSVECVLWKMGIDTSEFTAPGNGGRVQIYVGNGASDPTGTAPPEATLTGSLSTLEKYDLALFACVGSQVDQTAADQKNVINYSSAGGRVYGTHYSYVWLYDDAPFQGTATWNVQGNGGGGGQNGNVNVNINTTFPKGQLLSQWLTTIGASTTPGVIPMGNLKNDFTSANAPSQTWLTWQGQNPNWPLHYTFNTPVNATPGAQCGRVVFSDFHVDGSQMGGTGGRGGTGGGGNFPSECGSPAPLTPQEKVLEFMLFDLASCVAQTTPPPPTCTPNTCEGQGFQCGPAADGCGNLIQCGPCDAGSCGGGGQANICGSVISIK